MTKKLKVVDVAKQFGVCPTTLLRLVNDGTLADICDISVGRTGRKTYLFYQERIDAHKKNTKELPFTDF